MNTLAACAAGKLLKIPDCQCETVYPRDHNPSDYKFRSMLYFFEGVGDDGGQLTTTGPWEERLRECQWSARVPCESAPFVVGSELTRLDAHGKVPLLVVTGATLVVTGALLVVTRS